jgi:hypothetical protein
MLTTDGSGRGSLGDKTAFVYYFAFAGGFNGPRPLGFWSPPSRRVLWLRRDGGVFRMACDGWDGCLFRHALLPEALRLANERHGEYVLIRELAGSGTEIKLSVAGKAADITSPPGSWFRRSHETIESRE